MGFFIGSSIAIFDILVDYSLLIGKPLGVVFFVVIFYILFYGMIGSFLEIIYRIFKGGF